MALIIQMSLKRCIFLNTRNDRRYRTIQLIELVLGDINPDFFIIRGDNVKSICDRYNFDNKNIEIFDMSSKPEEIVNQIIMMNNFFILGIGNIVGWGEEFVKKLKEYS